MALVEASGSQVTATRENFAAVLKYCLMIFLAFGLVKAVGLLRIYSKSFYLIVTRMSG